jgi:cbb3-type cytochrome oxidase subunit 1
MIRLLGGLTYLAGMLLMAYNIYQTVRLGNSRHEALIPAPAH